MNRKTNLFYNNSNDAEFLTFSNYTEAMTGNFLSTDTKMFPSRFLCLNIPKLTEATKSSFIKEYLIGLYENKLAVLRDRLQEEARKNKKVTYTVESQIASLGYLIDAIKKYDDSAEIVYVGEISEQDFNGTFTDTICIVDTSYYKKGTITDTCTEELLVEDMMNPGKLYGWWTVSTEGVNQFLFENNLEYKSIVPIYDKPSNWYNVYPKFKKISLVDVATPDSQATNIKSVKFNVIIPLFDIINIDYKGNSYVLAEKDYIDLMPKADPEDSDYYNPPYIANVPLGIWFAPMNAVELARDPIKHYAQTWSLVIGNQFKPFPYSTQMPSEIDRTHTATAFMTFAEALTNQNNIIDKLNTLQTSLVELQTKFGDLEKRVSDIPVGPSNMDSLRQEMIRFKQEVMNHVEELEDTISNTELRWVNREG